MTNTHLGGTLLGSGWSVSPQGRAERESNLRSTPKGRPKAGFDLTASRAELPQSPPVGAVGGGVRG